MTHTTTMTQQFAAEYAKGVVPRMLKAIKTIKRVNQLILLGALAASYLHQQHYLDQLGAGLFAWIVPGVFDLGIVSMLTIAQTPGMLADAKRAAMKILAGLVLISGTINFLAPGAIELRIIFALVVALIAAVEWVAGKIRPDFTAIEAYEAEMSETAQPTVRKLDPEIAKARAAKAAATRKANREAQELAVLTPQQRAARTRQANRERTAQDELAQMLDGHVPADAPVSPAPMHY